MTDRRSYTVVGPGAVGLLYGARLASAGHRVRWLARSDIDEIRERGIEVRTEGRILRIDPADVEVYDDASEVPESDCIIVALKTTADATMTDLVSALCRPGNAVALFQNGLGGEERVRASVPAAGAVIGAMCFVCVHRTAPGRAAHLDYGAVTLAALDAIGAGSVEQLAGDLSGAGISAVVAPDLGVARWRKLVWNIPFNGLATILDARTDQLLANHRTRRLVSDLMDEVIAAAHACGSPVPLEFRDEMMATTDAMAPYEPSMLLDHRGGRELEVEAIYDRAIERARAAGARMPSVEAVAAILHGVDDHIARRH